MQYAPNAQKTLCSLEIMEQVNFSVIGFGEIAVLVGKTVLIIQSDLEKVNILKEISVIPEGGNAFEVPKEIFFEILELEDLFTV